MTTPKTGEPAVHECETVHFQILVSREVLRTIMARFQRFGRTCCFCQGLLHPKYGGMRYILNAGTNLPDNTTSHLRGLLNFIFCIATTYFTVARSALDVN
jgi:hypothetical protein